MANTSPIYPIYPSGFAIRNLSLFPFKIGVEERLPLNDQPGVSVF